MSYKDLSIEEMRALLADAQKKETKKKKTSSGVSFTREGDEIVFSFKGRPNKPRFSLKQIQMILNGYDDLEEMLEEA